jgi:hypothetical protein
MEYSQKYCLVHFITPLDVGSEFSMNDWPLHITLVNVFAVDRKHTGINAQLEKLLRSQPIIKSKALYDTVLGTTPVVLISKSPPILKLHEKIIDLLKTNKASFNMPEHIKTGYIPHCTIQNTEKLKSGEEVTINTLSLVDMFPENDWQLRKVLATFKLQE